jgi:GT2 family glycosyltransferase
MSKLCTFAIPVIRPDLLENCLRTLYKYTEPGTFNVIVIDQTRKGLDINLRERYQDLVLLRSPITQKFYTGNVGFQFANNLALRLTDTPFYCFLNDDVEFISNKWFKGVMDTFKMIEDNPPTADRPPLLVNVASTKLPDWSVGLPRGQHHDIIPYKKEYTDEDWEFLLSQDHYVNEHLTIKPKSVFDGINLYCSVARTDLLRKIGIDDLWYPGSAGDYDLSNVASMWGYRCISTTLSWVYHHWSVSFQAATDEEDIKELVIPQIHHTDLREKWWTNFELWGTRCPACEGILHTDDGILAICPKHKDQIYSIPPNVIEYL